MIRKTKVAITTLGCAKNFVDSQKFAREIHSAGAEFVSQPGRADVLIINTCGFTGDAREESIHTILEAVHWKERKSGRRVMAMGCFTQRDGMEIAEGIPELDGVFGIGDWTTMLQALELNPLKRNGSFALLSSPLSAGPGYAYLRISDGCSMGCSFCSIPQMRGFLRSEPMEKLTLEAKALAESGARELILIGQETTSYGVDIYGQRMLPELLWQLNDIPEIRWLRLLYFHPPSTTPKFLENIMRVPKVCSYLDFPIEHASNEGATLSELGQGFVSMALPTIEFENIA
ncbi:radical SAM protein, partial [bacterium]|nr:radical SAM protein [bacterium]